MTNHAIGGERLGRGGKPERDSRSCHQHDENWRPDRTVSFRKVYEALKFLHWRKPFSGRCMKSPTGVQGIFIFVEDIEIVVFEIWLRLEIGQRSTTR